MHMQGLNHRETEGEAVHPAPPWYAHARTQSQGNRETEGEAVHPAPPITGKQKVKRYIPHPPPTEGKAVHLAPWHFETLGGWVGQKLQAHL